MRCEVLVRRKQDVVFDPFGYSVPIELKPPFSSEPKPQAFTPPDPPLHHQNPHTRFPTASTRTPLRSTSYTSPPHPSHPYPQSYKPPPRGPSPPPFIQHGKAFPLQVHILRSFLEPFCYTVDTLADEGRFVGSVDGRSGGDFIATFGLPSGAAA